MKEDVKEYLALFLAKMAEIFPTKLPAKPRIHFENDQVTVWFIVGDQWHTWICDEVDLNLWPEDFARYIRTEFDEHMRIQSLKTDQND